MRNDAEAMRAIVVTLRPTLRPALRKAVFTRPVVESPLVLAFNRPAIKMRIAASIAAPAPMNDPACASPPSCVARHARATERMRSVGAMNAVQRRDDDLRFEI